MAGQKTMIDRYVLVGQTPVPEPDLLTWARTFEASDRHVALSRVFDVATVSTVFLGLDHNMHRFLGGGKPLLFETMVFWDGEGGEEQDRCSTWSEAEAMHAAMVREVVRPRTYFAYVLRQMWAFLEAAGSELKKALREI
jgi:hypothetical protein